MNYHNRLPSYFAWFAFCALIGCSEKKDIPGPVKISIHDPYLYKTIRVFAYKSLDQVDLAYPKMDAGGNVSMKFTLRRPTFAFIQLGDKYSEVYLAAKTDIMVSGDEDAPEKPLHFSGHGGDLSNYLAHSALITEQIKAKSGNYITQLEPPAFLQRYDSLKTALTHFCDAYIDSLHPSADIADLLKKKNDLKLLALALEYTYTLQTKALSAESGVKEFILPDRLHQAIKNIPFDPVFLKLGIFDYQMILLMYLHTKIYSPICFQDASVKPKYIESKADLELKNGDYPAEVKEYLIALNVNHWLNTTGITPSVDSILTSFKNTYSDSKHLPALQKSYDDWLTITPGKMAPDIAGTTIDGMPVSLRDLSGKVVYIDVWATWCKPCREEIPHAKRLQKKFAGNSNIVFLNVSVDADLRAWIKMIEGDKEWEGIHINQTQEQRQALWKSYKMYEVPTYIIIDRAGKIVSVQAKKPSDPELQDELKALLK
jgi:thiol-disulfide isomerase/thioredoxin